MNDSEEGFSMTGGPAYAFPQTGVMEPVSFEPELCIGCNICVDVCQVDVMIPNPEEGLPPIVAFPGECWYDGSCVDACPEPGAISLNSLPRNRVHIRRKETGHDSQI